MDAGPAGWVISQGLLLLYYYLDNGSNTCGIDFHFENEKKECFRRINSTSSAPADLVVEHAGADAVSDEVPQVDSVSIVDAEQPENSTPIIDNGILRKLFVKEFKMMSEQGR